MVRIITGPWHNVMLPKTCQQIGFMEILFSLRWYVELILQGRTLSLYSNSSVVFSEEEPALQCRRQYCSPDSKSLKPGSGAIEGVPDLGVSAQPDYILLCNRPWRLCLVSGWDFTWRGRQARQYGYVYLLLCNRPCVTLAPSGVYINRRVLVHRTTHNHTIG